MSEADKKSDGVFPFLENHFTLTKTEHIPSNFLSSTNLLFSILERHAGIIVQTGGPINTQRQFLHLAGMPQDLMPVNLYLLTLVRDEQSDDFSFGDFALHVSGVIVDKNNKEHGWSGRALIMERKETGTKFSIHMGVVV